MVNKHLQIGVIGAGAVGGALARQLAALGHEVAIANSRGPETLTALAAEIGATPGSVRDAGEAADVVILAIPTTAVLELPSELFAHEDVAVVDTANYHPELRDGRIAAIDDGMLESEWVARRLGRPVVKAFNSIYPDRLLAQGRPAGASDRRALPVAGDPPAARATVLRLVDELGFDPVDAGGLDESWRQQTGTPAYCEDLDAGALRCALAGADRGHLAAYRVAREAQIRREIGAG